MAECEGQQVEPREMPEPAPLGEQFLQRLMGLGYRRMHVSDGTSPDHTRSYIVPPVCDIPAGPFLMGSDPQRDTQARQNEVPQQEIDVSAFQIAAYPLTVAEYACAVQATSDRQMERIETDLV